MGTQCTGQWAWLDAAKCGGAAERGVPLLHCTLLYLLHQLPSLAYGNRLLGSQNMLPVRRTREQREAARMSWSCWKMEVMVEGRVKLQLFM